MMETVGWSMFDRLKSTLCEDALNMAIRNRRPSRGLTHHSERRLRLVITTSFVQVLRRPFESAQYACGDYRKLLTLHGINASMSRKGNCQGNAPMESFFSSLKTELVHRTRFTTRREARAAFFEYIEIFYNYSSQPTFLYVVDAKRFSCARHRPAGRLELLRARRMMLCAAAPWRSAWRNSQGSCSRGWMASMSPRSAASRSVLDDGAHDALLDLGDAGQRPVPTRLQLTRHETVLGISGIILPKGPVGGVACCLEVADQRFPGFVTSR